MGQLREETQITVEMRQKTRELEVGTLVDAELKKPLWNTYEGYIKSLEVLAKDFEKIQEISDKAKRINEAGKETLKHVETTAKARKKHLEGVIVNVKRAQTGMNLSNDEPVGPIHEANFLEIFGEYLALKNDLKH
ncbi:MAG: hypothetical protein LBG59_01070 [Candidatus Peribacteria bacterium]|jgi:hypothetical protein|nr:hypothetical protein [Candidatus Peribacteria bacterium]